MVYLFQMASNKSLAYSVCNAVWKSFQKKPRQKLLEQRLDLSSKKIHWKLKKHLLPLPENTMPNYMNPTE